MSLKHLALVTGGGIHHLAPQDTYIQPFLQDQEMQLICLIHRNRHKEAKRGDNTFRMKEQDKPPENELNETEICNLSDKEFK